jgi:NAD(P)-dependent dehydrogenase (short-subunit alcohol dehydrogenase family)
VVASDINKEGLETTLKIIKENGGEAIGVLADITNVEDVRKIKNEALNKYGKINAIYIVPGISVRKPIEELSYSEFDRIIEVNLKGHFIVTKFKHLFSVQGLVAVVTGAASGIGQAISYVFAMNGGKWLLQISIEKVWKLL